MLGASHLEVLCNVVTLIYHEARNVRHLVHERLLPSEKWRYLVSLPTNRSDAWRTLVPIRAVALASPSAERALGAFETRFRVSLAALADMFANENWLHAKLYGGNAWAVITRLAIELAEGLRGENESVDRLVRELEDARHNTGSLAEKLDRLERAAEAGLSTVGQSSVRGVRNGTRGLAMLYSEPCSITGEPAVGSVLMRPPVRGNSI